ncbi:MAG: hypothetical protein RL632_1717 [Bacteroidota bacterium]|jgi:hypothetical protein
MRTTAFIHKVTNEDRKTNEDLLKMFSQNLYCTIDDAKMQQLLHPNGRFFGNMNYLRAIAFLRKKVTGRNGIGDRYFTEINYGVATDHKIGETVMEIRFSDFDPFTDTEDPSHDFGDCPDYRFDELIFYFAFSFKDGKIFSIRFPRSFEKSIAWIAARN